MRKIALLSLAALLILSVFGAANAQLVGYTVTLSEGRKDAPIADNSWVNCYLQGSGGNGFLVGRGYYVGEGGYGRLEVYFESGSRTVNVLLTDDSDYISINAQYIEGWYNEFYRVMVIDAPIPD